MEILKQIDSMVSSLKDELTSTLQAFVQIPSVKSTPTPDAPFGVSIQQALLFFMKQCQDFGFNAVERNGLYGFADFGSGEKMFGVFGHLDVVPAGNGWSVPPFSGTILDNKIISRGTMDDKGGLICALFAMRALQKLGFEPQKTIRLFFGCDEETNFTCIDTYVRDEKLPDSSIVVDGNFPVTYYEKGIFHFKFTCPLSSKNANPIKIEALQGGEKCNVVAGEAMAIFNIPLSLQTQFQQKVEQFQITLNNLNHAAGPAKFMMKKLDENRVQIEVDGHKAHSSLAPQGLSAIAILLMFLSSIDEIQGKDFFDFFADKVGYRVHGEGLSIFAQDEESGKLTANPGILNLQGNAIELQFDVRYPVTTSIAKMHEAILESISKTDIHFQSIEEIAPMRTDPDGVHVKTLMETYTACTGISINPTAMGGITYAHIIPEACAFGPNHPGVKKLAHMADEYADLNELLETTRIYAKALYQLTKDA